MSEYSAIVAAMCIADGALLASVPRISPRRYLFGVTTAPEFRSSAEARASLRRYETRVAIATAAAVALAMSLWAPIVPIVGGAIAFAMERNRLMRIAPRAPDTRAASLATDERVPAWTLLALPPFAALGGVALWLRAHWAQIPESFPVHWGPNGQANGWSTNTPHDVYGPLAFGAGVMALILLLGVASFYGARRGPMRFGMLKVLIAAAWLMGYIFSMVGLLPLLHPSPLMFLVPVPLFVVGIIWWAMRAYADSPGDAAPDECWHGGGIYYNPADPALFVEKRMGFGYTFNFGNRLSWVFLGGFLAVIAGLVFLLR